MPIPSARIVEQLNADFGAAAPMMVSPLERVAVSPQVDAERVHAAILMAARGNRSMFDDALEHAREDWRDLLVRTGLADDHAWHDVVDAKFGENPPT
ncbi:hypothetical protein [Demequina aurantiaca]|uniref:hypothetical protein n=1 Tax=Demequina aurantiaca TaxID=676200 RepID=UPI0007819133|nr:hypothetical protein [Demequina aurantiaca]